jgi:hypothetical protein
MTATTAADGRTRQELRTCSWHESGHAVLGVLFRCQVEIATIQEDIAMDQWGHVRCKPPLDTVRRIALLAAGFCAELRGEGRAETFTSAKDIRDMAAALNAAYPDGRPAGAPEFREGVELAVALVRHHWPSIKKLARRLRCKTSVTGQEIHSIVAKNRRRISK